MKWGFFDIVVEDVSKSAVSCLNFEPRVSKFPSISSHLVANNAFTTIKNPFLFFRDLMGERMRWGFFDIVAKDASKPSVSFAYYIKKSIFLFISYEFLILPHNIRITITLP